MLLQRILRILGAYYVCSANSGGVLEIHHWGFRGSQQTILTQQFVGHALRHLFPDQLEDDEYTVRYFPWSLTCCVNDLSLVLQNAYGSYTYMYVYFIFFVLTKQIAWQQTNWFYFIFRPFCVNFDFNCCIAICSIIRFLISTYFDINLFFVFVFAVAVTTWDQVTVHPVGWNLIFFLCIEQINPYQCISSSLKHFYVSPDVWCNQGRRRRIVSTDLYR